MKRNKLIERIAAFALIALPLTSCSEDKMDEINADKNNPQSVTAKFTMADVMTRTAVQTVNGDLSLYATVYMEHEVGIENQLYNAEIRTGEPNVASTYNNSWNSIYQNIRNVKAVIKKCSEGGDEFGNNVTLGIAKLLYAYNIAVLTDIFGDVPFNEACEYEANGIPTFMQPSIDKQEAIYTSILDLIEESMILLDGTDAISTLGQHDLIYGPASGGRVDAEKALWKKAAYAMKARYTMRLLARSSDQNASLNTVLDCISNSFTSAAEELKFDVYDGSNQFNPFFDFMYSRTGLGASKSLISKFIDRQDPRLNQSFATDWYYAWGEPLEQVTDGAETFAAPNGTPVQGTMNYDCSMVSWSITAPTQLLSYHELLFLKAEALCRLNRISEAETALRQGITAGFANLSVALRSTLSYGIEGTVNLSEEVANTYYTTSVQPLFNRNPLQEIMIQKYLSFFGASGEALEAYSDYRRLKALGEDFIVLENPHNATKFPQRYTYGSSDVLSNQNIKEAFGDGQYVYSEPVWWAGGSR